MQVDLVEYGVGNIHSVANALARVGAEPRIACSGDELRAGNGSAIVLPGVGAIGESLRMLRERDLESALVERVLHKQTPFLGICVGMQMMAERCEEFGEQEGLGWIPGRVRRLAEKGAGLRVPHVGWNQIEVAGAGGILEGLDGEHFYFVHSYAVDCPKGYVRAWANYGRRFVAAIGHGNLAGVQFHPEKSSGAGETLLAAFLEAAKTGCDA